MIKRITLVCALIGAVAFLVSPAYAEVQNIKVSGDIKALAVHRHNYDLEDGHLILSEPEVNPSNYVADDRDSFLMSIARLRIDADLTDNVGATVRLANVRDWDADTRPTTYSETDSANADIVLDLAYVTLKEMLYSPLTLIIGRQELMYGTGLIIGPSRYHDPNDSIEYNDLSPLHGYDAVRAILDYDPWTLDLLFSKMTEADDDVLTPVTQTRDSDIDLYGLNLGYRFDSYDAEMEGYFFYKKDEQFDLTMYSNDEVSRSIFDENKVYTLGLRGSAVPIENLTLNGEVAGQWGEMWNVEASSPVSNELSRDREAMLASISGEYDFADVRFNPVVGLDYLYLSGEEIDSDKEEYRDDGDFEAWDPMYRAKVLGGIRDCLESFYSTNDGADSSAFTNQHTIKASGSLDLGELVDGLSVDLAYLHYWFAEEPVDGADDNIGDELSLGITYDYTEDVTFALDSAIFMPGDYYDDVHPSRIMGGGGMGLGRAATDRVSNDNAVSVIGSCAVAF